MAVVLVSAADEVDADDADEASSVSVADEDATAADGGEVPALCSWILMDELMTRRDDIALRMPSRVVLGHIFCLLILDER